MCAMQVLLALSPYFIETRTAWRGFTPYPKININLSKIKSCNQLQVFVNSTAEFTNQHLVANGASDLICEYIENKTIAQHTRCAVGVATLPLGALVEVGAIFTI